MKITKYEHSCLDIELEGKRLLIDPGVVTNDVPNYENIVAVVVTHVHADHLDAEKLKAIQAQNPEAPIYTVQAVADELKDSVPVTVVTGGHKVETGPFQLEFSGGQHAVIHESIPVTDNVGVTVNGQLYDPGDSFSTPHIPVDILALPITAPWSKVSETMDFIKALKPKRVFPIHNALLSEWGHGVYDYGVKAAAESVGAKYILLKPGESLSV